VKVTTVPMCMNLWGCMSTSPFIFVALCTVKHLVMFAGTLFKCVMCFLSGLVNSEYINLILSVFHALY
jgi:hypothetical protein